MPSATPERPLVADDPTTRALRVLGLLVVLLDGSTETISWGLGTMAQSPATRVGVWLILAAQALVVPALLVRRAPRPVAWALLATTLAGMVLTAANRGAAPLVEHWTPGYWVAPLLCVALVAHRRPGYVAFAVAGCLGLWSVMPLAGATTDLPSLADAMFSASPVLEVLLFGDALGVIAHARDASVARERDALTDHAQQSLDARARREAARLLHDHVLHALHALGRPAGTASEAMLVEECRSAHDAMVHRARPARTARVEDLVEADPALDLAAARLDGHAEPLPWSVAVALEAAVHEALSNVARHAQATRCRVSVAQEADGVRVDVVDDGRGFDTSRRPTGRLGVGHSIVQRMADIGGVASLESRPGQGTRVTLRWPAPGGATSHDGWLEAPATLVRARLTTAAWPGLVVGTAMTLLCAHRLHPAGMVLFTGLGAMLVGVLCAGALRHRRLAPWESAALMTTAMVGWLLNLSLVPTAPATDYLLWMAWASSTLVHLLVLSLPPVRGRWIVATWVVFQLMTFVLRYPGLSTLWDLSSVITSGAGEPLITLLAVSVASRVSAQEADAARASAQMRLEAARLQRESQLDHYWSARVTEEALPLLLGVADGTTDPLDPAVRATALAMEAALRDELVLGPGNADLIAALARVRSDGWALTSTLGPDDAPESLRQAQRLLRLLGRPAQQGQAVTLSAGRLATQAVVFGASPSQQGHWADELHDLGGIADLDPDFTRLGLPRS